MTIPNPQVRALVNDAVTLTARKDLRGAEERFVRAVELTDRIENHDEKRHTCTGVAFYLIRCGFPAMTERVAKTAIPLHERAGDTRGVVACLLSYGSAVSHLGQPIRAIEIFTQARDLARSVGSFAEAASGSTNLGATYMKVGRVAEAVPHFEQSLAWLADHPFPDTEIQTRLNLLSAHETLGAPAAQCLALGRETAEKFGEKLNEHGFGRMMTQVLSKTLTRLASADRTRGDAAWLRARFPDLRASQ